MAQDNIIEELHESLNAPFVSIEESFNNLKLVFGLLQTGYYALIDTELYPTNGNGEFFWKTLNSPTLNEASCPAYGGDALWSEPYPKYILPTQPPTKFNRAQTEYYRENDNYRSLAYYLDGYLTGLLDGHHKAVASALEKRPVKALVIIPTTGAAYRNKDLKGHKGGIYLNGVYLSEDEMLSNIGKVIDSFKSKSITDDETAGYLSKINTDFQEYEWSPDILATAEYYPGPTALARIEWAGGISDERLDDIINNEEVSPSEALNIATALFILKNPRFKQLTFHFCRMESLIQVWYELFTLLAKIKDQEVEEFFIEFLVNYDYASPHPEIKKIVDNYFISV